MTKTLELRQVSPYFWLAIISLNSPEKSTWTEQFIITEQQIPFLRALCGDKKGSGE